mgnify:CR=1 FL=1
MSDEFTIDEFRKDVKQISQNPAIYEKALEDKSNELFVKLFTNNLLFFIKNSTLLNAYFGELDLKELENSKHCEARTWQLVYIVSISRGVRVRAGQARCIVSMCHVTILNAHAHCCIRLTDWLLSLPLHVNCQHNCQLKLYC